MLHGHSTRVKVFASTCTCFFHNAYNWTYNLTYWQTGSQPNISTSPIRYSSWDCLTHTRARSTSHMVDSLNEHGWVGSFIMVRLIRWAHICSSAHSSPIILMLLSIKCMTVSEETSSDFIIISFFMAISNNLQYDAGILYKFQMPNFHYFWQKSSSKCPKYCGII